MIEREKCQCPDDACFDPAHEKFWMPSNWPMGRAPVRIDLGERDCTVTATVVLQRDWPNAWIRGYRGDVRDVWSSCGGRPSHWQLESMVREVEQERDIEVFGGLGMATEALLECLEAA